MLPHRKRRLGAAIALALLASVVPLRTIGAQAGTAPPVGMTQGPVGQRPMPVNWVGGQATTKPLTHLLPTGAQYVAAPTTAGASARPMVLPKKSPPLRP
ncbi:MAG: hypothetical protein GC161_15685 [Planctomycetaceae bacterium]|nr:hypothetical protein [Planctomycetaceae bacterium]